MSAGLRGRILDAGIGSGRNIPFYPPGTDVVGIDASPAMLLRASRRAQKHAAPLQLLERDVMDTGFDYGEFDAVVATFPFCVLEEAQQRPALAERGRITKPGGEIRILDYVLPPRPPRRWIAKAWAPWIRLAFGASFERCPERYANAAGVELLKSRFVLDQLIRSLTFRPRNPS